MFCFRATPRASDWVTAPVLIKNTILLHFP
jgi:hypothetical protein